MYFRASPDGAEELGAVAHSGGPVGHGSGELGRLAEVVLLVFRGLVVNSWVIQGRDRETKCCHYQC